MKAINYSTGQKDGRNGLDITDVAERLMKKNPELNFAQAVVETLRNDTQLAKKYLKKEDEPKLASDGAIIPRNYEHAVQALMDEAEKFHLEYKLPMDMSLRMAITKPHLRLCARSYLSQVHKVKKT